MILLFYRYPNNDIKESLQTWRIWLLIYDYSIEKFNLIRIPDIPKSFIYFIQKVVFSIYYLIMLC